MKTRKEIIKELPKEMKSLNSSDIGNWEEILSNIKEGLKEKDTNVLSYQPVYSRFNIQFENLRYIPRFNEFGKFKWLKKFLNKYYNGTYLMDVKIREGFEDNSSVEHSIFNAIPMTTKSLYELNICLKSFIEERQYIYLQQLRRKKAKELAETSAVISKRKKKSNGKQ